MAVVVQVLVLGGEAIAAAVALEQAVGGRGIGETRAALGDACVEQVEDALVEAEVGAEREGDLRVLVLQALDLGVDALHQHAGEEVRRHDADLCHAEAGLALHHGLEPRPGHAGEGEVDQLVVAVLEDPACHPGELAVGAGVRRAAAEQDHAGGLRVGHGELAHQAIELAAQHGEDLPAHAEVAGAGEADAGVTRAGACERGGQFHLDVAGGIEDEGDREHVAGVARGAVEALVEQHVGVLDEAGLDAPAGMALAPLRGEVQDLLVALALARAVADEEEDGVVHADSPVAMPAGIDALRKRWPKPGS